MEQNKVTFPVAEHFISINGEGRRAGQLALFIRFAGCNLNCEYCDTKWANEPSLKYQEYTVEQLLQLVKESKVKNITLTGGEPLIQPHINLLLDCLRTDASLRVEIETNGSIDIKPLLREPKEGDNVSFTIDYKTSISGMEETMHKENYVNLRSQDTVKFVVGSKQDLYKAKQVIESYGLLEKGCGIYLSPCFGAIEPHEIVDFVVENRWNDVNVQLQLHKFIWDPDKRGV